MSRLGVCPLSLFKASPSLGHTERLNVLEFLDLAPFALHKGPEKKKIVCVFFFPMPANVGLGKCVLMSGVQSC